MVKICSRKFGAAEKLKHSAKRDRGAARGVNKQHHKLKLACSSTPPQKTVQLRDFQQEWFFSDIVGLTDKQAEMMLRRFGVLPKKGGVVLCWQCVERMSQASSSTGADSGDVKQCCNCKVPGRFAGFLYSPCLYPHPLSPEPHTACEGRHYLQLRHSHVAWTPFWHGCTRGYAPKYAAFLRLCYCLGVRTPPDALPHYVNDKKAQAGPRTLRWWVEALRCEPVSGLVFGLLGLHLRKLVLASIFQAVRYALRYVAMKEQTDVLLKDEFVEESARSQASPCNPQP